MQCNHILRAQISTQLEGFKRTPTQDGAERLAAVALVLIDGAHGADLQGMPVHDKWSDDACLLLTRRSSKLRNHPGQWALPGGRVDEDETLEQAALRELDEEVGLKLAPAQVLGKLDDFVTRSGYVMTPVVIWGGAITQFHPNEDEVASIHRIPLTEFMRSDAPLLEHEHEADPHPVLRMPVGDAWIAAPTAALIYQFVEVCIRGKSTRVAHYEQPRFAWK